MSGIAKGLEIVGDRRIIDRVAAELRAAHAELVLAANDPAAAQWLPGVAVVSDRHRAAGGIAGVESALSLGRDAIVVAWDMPFVTASLLELLIAEARSHDALVAIPESESPYGIEPFCGFYSAAVLPLLSSFLDGGGGAARSFLERVPRVHRIPLASVARLGDPGRLLFSVNTPDDLARAREMAGAA